VPFYDFEEDDPKATNDNAIAELKKRGYVKDGDLVIATKGDFKSTGGTNTLKILTVS